MLTHSTLITFRIFLLLFFKF